MRGSRTALRPTMMGAPEKRIDSAEERLERMRSDNMGRWGRPFGLFSSTKQDLEHTRMSKLAYNGVV